MCACASLAISSHGMLSGGGNGERVQAMSGYAEPSAIFYMVYKKFELKTNLHLFWVMLTLHTDTILFLQYLFFQQLKSVIYLKIRKLICTCAY